MGETLPFLLWRFDSRAKLYGIKFPKSPSQYIKDNIVVTTSGMCSAEPLACTISALGHEHVMFASDFPFESAPEAAEFIDGAPIDADIRDDICYNNAARLFGLRTTRKVS
jgi:2,3-dihydroxybenzoate decarboxylase